MRRRHLVARTIRLGLLSSLLATPTAQAVATLTWTGQGLSTSFSGYDALARKGNFAPLVPEEHGEYALVFDGALKTRPVNDVRYLQIQSLSFASGAAGFEISGHAFSLHGDLVNRSKNRQVVHNPLVLKGEQRWFGGEGGLLVDGGIDMVGGHVRLDQGATMRPDQVSFGSGLITVLPGGALDLTHLGYENVVLFGDIDRGSGTSLIVQGVGAGKGVLLPNHSHFTRSGLSVLDGAQLEVGYHLSLGNHLVSRGEWATLALRGAGSQLTVAGNFQFGGEGVATAEVREGGLLRANSARIDGAVDGWFDTRLVVGAGGQWNSAYIDLASRSRNKEAILEMQQGGTLQLYGVVNGGAPYVSVGATARSDDPNAMAARLLVNGGRLLGTPHVFIGSGGVGRFELGGGGQAELGEVRVGSADNKLGRGQLWVSGAGTALQADSLTLARGSVELLDGARMQLGSLLIQPGQAFTVQGAELGAQTASLQGGGLLNVQGGQLSFVSLSASGVGNQLLLGAGSRLSSHGLQWQGGLLQVGEGAELDTVGESWRVDTARVGGDTLARVELTGGQWRADQVLVSGSRGGELLLHSGGLVGSTIDVGVGAGQTGRLVSQLGSWSSYGLDLHRLTVGTGQGQGRVELASGSHTRLQELLVGAGGRLEVAGGSARFSVAQARVEQGGQLLLGDWLGAGIGELSLAGGELQRGQRSASLGTLSGHGRLLGDLSGMGNLFVDADRSLQAGALRADDGFSAGYAFLDAGARLALDYRTPALLSHLRLHSRNQVGSTQELVVGRLETVGGGSEITAPVFLQGNVHLNFGELVLSGDVRASGQFDTRYANRNGSGTLALLAGFRPEQLDTQFALPSVRLGEGTHIELDLASGTQFERLRFDGLLQAGGTLALNFSDATAWQAGATLDLLDWGSLQGGFSAFRVTGLDAARVDFSRIGLDGTVSISAVPEPTPALLLALGLAALALRRRRPDSSVR